MGYFLLAFTFVAIVVLIVGTALTGASFLTHLMDVFRSIG